MTFFPTDPQDKWRTYAEQKDWIRQQDEIKRKERRDTFRFWTTTAITSIAAIAAVAGVLIQLFSKQ